MEKQFPLVLNITKPIDPQNHIRFFRGDNVQFIFSYIDGAGNPPSIISEAVKLRVYAKKIYADGVKKEEMPIFSGEFADKEVASFSSLQTAGDAGNYLMAVILLDASGNVITAQGIYLDLLENGYAGVYQPSPDFRDEVLDALAQAQAAAANAAASASSAQASLSAGENLYQQGLQEGNAILADCNSAKTAAESSAQSAEASAGIAAQQASDAESAKDAAVAAKNTATTQAGLAADSADNAALAAQQAQQAAAQAVEITDPEGWRTDTRAMIARLALTKSDSGTLYCNGGMAKTNSAGFTTLSKASMLVRFARKNTTRSEKEYICNIGDGETVNTGISVVLLTDNRISVPLYLQKTDGTKFGTYISAFDASEYLDGKMHSLAVCFAGTSAKAYVDGVLKGSVFNITSGSTIVASNINITLAGRGATNKQFFYGQVSDFRIFNFDVSATDAPYTVADYQNGKRLPPSMQSSLNITWNATDVPIYSMRVGSFFEIPAGSVGFFNAPATIAYEDDGSISWTTKSATSGNTYILAYRFKKAAFSSGKVKVNIGALTSTLPSDAKFYINYFNTSGNASNSTRQAIGTSGGSFEFDYPDGCVGIGIQIVASTKWEIGNSLKVASVSVVVLGASVALENYTIARNTTTKLIKDASGNGNDATVSGNVAGDMDAAVAAFVDEIKTQISQQS